MKDAIRAALDELNRRPGFAEDIAPPQGMRMPVCDRLEGSDDPTASLTCDQCQGTLRPDDLVVVDDEMCYCEICADEFAKKLLDEAKEYALRNCRVTRPLECYDPDKGHAPTREEYELGIRHAHTPNSVHCGNRHNRTNYDDLLPDRHDDSMRAEIFSLAISSRIEFLLEEAARDGVVTDGN